MTAARTLCEPWCEHHDDAGPGEQWCTTVDRVVHAVTAPEESIGVSVGRYQLGWDAHSATVYLDVPGQGVSLLPHEARRVARLLLAGADVADGVAATWD